MPKISVVIPCYNASAYIVRCLDALEHQTFKVFDVFVIDDCSSDNTVEVIKEYQEKSSMIINILKNPKNCGPAESRQKGIQASESDFICFCDCDDWYDENYLQELSDSQKKNDSDIVFCSFRFVFESGRSQERLNIYNKEDLHETKRVLIKAPDSLCIMMVRRDILLKVPHPNMRNGEDMALIPLLVCKSSHYSAVNKCLYNYFCRGNSASRKPTKQMIESLEGSFAFVERHLSASYQQEKEFIGIRILLYGAFINLFKFSFNTIKTNQLLDGFESTYPNWHSNPNLKELSVSKRFFLKCVHKRYWVMAKFISHIHSLLLK